MLKLYVIMCLTVFLSLVLKKPTPIMVQEKGCCSKFFRPAVDMNWFFTMVSYLGSTCLLA